MPHLTLGLNPLGGPLVDIQVGVTAFRAAVLAALGQAIPAPVTIRALVDTGASGTCLDTRVIQQLNLSPTGFVHVLTPSTGTIPHSTNTCDVNLTLLHPSLSTTFGPVPAIECNFQGQGFQALIGRDTLAHCLFVYDGKSGLFMLAF